MILYNADINNVVNKYGNVYIINMYIFESILNTKPGLPSFHSTEEGRFHKNLL